MKKSKRILFVSFACLLISTLAVSSATLAWINWRKQASALTLDSGSVKVSGFTSSVYKYFYPTYGSGSLINYQGVGTVSSSDISSIGSNYHMNKFDPTYLKITTGSSISKLNTNLVLKVSCTIETSVPVTLELSTVRNSDYVSGTEDKLSYFLHYQAISSTTFASLDASSYTGDDAKVFFPVKVYAEANSSKDVTFGSNTSCLIYTENLEGTENAAAQSFVCYVNLDYDKNLTDAVFYDAAHLGNNYTLSMDYTFGLKVRQSE